MAANPGFTDMSNVPGIQNLPANQGTAEIIAPVPNLQTDTILTAADIRNNFLYGVPITNTLGQTLTDDNIRFHIDAATAWLENYLQISIRQKYWAQERADYFRSEYMNWGMTRLYHLGFKTFAVLDDISRYEPNCSFSFRLDSN